MMVNASESFLFFNGGWYTTFKCSTATYWLGVWGRIFICTPEGPGHKCSYTHVPTITFWIIGYNVYYLYYTELHWKVTNYDHNLKDNISTCAYTGLQQCFSGPAANIILLHTVTHWHIEAHTASSLPMQLYQIFP